MAGFFMRQWVARAGQSFAGLSTELAGSDKKRFKSYIYVRVRRSLKIGTASAYRQCALTLEGKSLGWSRR
jgi:hypothetical protein